MQITTRDDIMACFRLLLGRTPHIEEMPGHLGFVGAPLASVVSSYLQSLEFRNRGLLEASTQADIVHLDGFSIYVAKDDNLIAPAIQAGYEPDVTRAFLSHMGQGAVLDIGANCGYFSLLAASRGADVYAFEPLQKNLRLLYASVAMNHFERMKIIAAAASDAPGTLTIAAAYTNGIVAETRNEAAAALTADFVAAIRVDDMIPNNEAVSLIKIDVEGHEYRAIMGARRIIKERRPVIISEFGPTGLAANSRRSGTEYLQLLFEDGYAVSVIGNPEANTVEAILESCVHKDHIDILAIPC